ncbi:MAG TPA: hypothetical protein VIV11_34140 [Kofleriaceae bacterium]
MGQLGVVVTRCCVVALVCAGAPAQAGIVLFDNGVTGEGFTQVSPDDFGTYGVLIGQQFDDEFIPAGVANAFTPTYLTGPMLFVSTASNRTSSLLLTEYRAWANFLENPPPIPDGIAADAMHTGLARTVTMPIASTGPNEATSGFRIATDTAAGVGLDFLLVQRLASDATAKSSQFDQIYTVTNSGTAAVTLVFHIMWDADLYYDGQNQEVDDFVGSVAGLCGVYMHDGDSRWSTSLGNGPMSTVPLAAYYGGKAGEVPGSGPAFTPANAGITEQHVWLNHGMPASWRNFVVGPGLNAVGESDPTLIADATIGTEYQFPLAVGATETVHIRRYYGTTDIECFVSANCGNGVVDSGELCDGTDTATCNGETCTASLCGDGYMNSVAGEECDSSGVDSETCNGATCTVAACGDGHVNVEAGEDCEDGELCETSTCTFSFRLGGGCAGCATGGPDPSWLLCAVLLVLRRRRR